MMIGIYPTHSTQKVLIKIHNLKNVPKRATRRALYEYGSILRKKLKNAIKKKGRTGRTYNIYRRGRKTKHIASAPFETPANITGKLKKSVDFKVEGDYKMKFGYDDSVDYGKHLEKGTKKMKPRTGLKNIIDKTQKQGRDKIREEINKRL